MEPAAAADKRHAAVLTLATDEKWPEEWRYCYVDFERVAARANEDSERADITREHIAGMLQGAFKHRVHTVQAVGVSSGMTHMALRACCPTEPPRPPKEQRHTLGDPLDCAAQQLGRGNRRKRKPGAPTAPAPQDAAPPTAAAPAAAERLLNHSHILMGRDSLLRAQHASERASFIRPAWRQHGLRKPGEAYHHRLPKAQLPRRERRRRAPGTRHTGN